MTLNDKQKAIMALIRRSTSENGWHKVSEQVWPVVEAAAIPSDLIEVNSEGGHYVRLTPNGEIVMKYLV